MMAMMKKLLFLLLLIPVAAVAGNKSFRVSWEIPAGAEVDQISVEWLLNGTSIITQLLPSSTLHISRTIDVQNGDTVGAVVFFSKGPGQGVSVTVTVAASGVVDLPPAPQNAAIIQLD